MTESTRVERLPPQNIEAEEAVLGALLIDPSIYDSLKGILGEAERSKFVRAAVRYLIDEEKANQSESNSSGDYSTTN